MNNDALGTIRQKVEWEQQNMDGLVIITKGFAFALIRLVFSYSPLVFLPLILLLPLIQYLKKTYTYPRIGYVRGKGYPRDGSSLFMRILFMLLALIVFWIGAWGLTQTYFSEYIWIGLAVGLMVSQGMSLGYQKWNRKSRYIIYDRIVLLLLLSSQLFIDCDILSLALVMSLYGIFNIAIGLYYFIKFIKENPVVESEAD